MILWVFLAMILKIPLTLLGEGANSEPYQLAGRIGGLVVMYTFLYLVLTFRYRVEEISRKLKILFGHLTGYFILTLPLQCS